MKLLKIVSRFETKETNYELNQELLNYINSNTYQKIAIYSSNTKKCVDDIVKKHFRKKPDIISKNNCIEPKPTDKDILSILEQWKFKNKNIIFIGNSQDDFISGKKASVTTHIIDTIKFNL